MSDKIKGTVEKVKKNGQFYSFVIDGTWRGAGKTRVEEGDTIEFEEYENDAGYLQAKNIKRIGSSGASKTSVAGRTGGNSGKSAEERGYWERREQREVANDAHYKARWAVSQALESAFKAVELGLVQPVKGATEESKREQALTLADDLAKVFLDKANKLSLTQTKGTASSSKAVDRKSPPKATAPDADGSESAEEQDGSEESEEDSENW